MARITVEDCQKRVNNRFLLVQMAIKRVQQFRQGYDPLVKTNNKEIVTALREIAAGKIIPEVVYYGDINMHSYNMHQGMGYGEAWNALCSCIRYWCWDIYGVVQHRKSKFGK